MTPGLVAAVFYGSVAALVAGTIRGVRASVERRARDPASIALAAAGALGLVAATLAYAAGPRTVLPF